MLLKEIMSDNSFYYLRDSLGPWSSEIIDLWSLKSVGPWPWLSSHKEHIGMRRMCFTSLSELLPKISTFLPIHVHLDSSHGTFHDRKMVSNLRSCFKYKSIASMSSFTVRRSGRAGINAVAHEKGAGLGICLVHFSFICLILYLLQNWIRIT